MASNGVELLIQEWERSKQGARDFIEAMPDEHVGFRPVPSVLSFAGQFLHIADANYMFASVGCGIPNPNQGQKSEEKPELQSKQAVLDFATAGYDFVIGALRNLDGKSMDEEVQFFKWTMPRHLVFSKALEHHAHHRGQTAVYFRLVGLKPPSERLF